jgi:hypothetical protein
MSFGPWRVDLPATERTAQMRCLAGLVAAFTGSKNPLIGELRSAERDEAAAGRALDLLNRQPALTRRKILSVFGAITWPTRPRK